MQVAQLDIKSAFVLHMRRGRGGDLALVNNQTLDEYFVPHIAQLTSRWQMRLRAAPSDIRTQLEKIDADYVRQIDDIMSGQDDCYWSWLVKTP